MKNKFILFDFDGVIADSFNIAFETAQTRCPSISEVDYRKKFEGNINEIKHSETFHDNECNHDLDWFEIYTPKIKSGCTLFSGMKEVILNLEKEYMLIIISSTITSPIEEFLSFHNMREHFDLVMGNDVHKSKVEKIKIVFEKYNVDGSDCLFITDTLGDIEEAKEMGVPAIGVTWGFCRPEILKRGNPLQLVHTPAELEAAITDYLPA